MANYTLNTVEEAIQAIKSGGLVIVADNEDRENEGDLVCAAEMITPDLITFMATEAKGLICMPMSREIAERLGLELMSCPTRKNRDKTETAFTVSIDGALDLGVGTGISSADRALTIKLAINDKADPCWMRVPGHVFPLIARNGGVLERTGQTEASVDLAKLAGLKPAGVICEILNPDGTMARRDELMVFSKKHNIPFVTVAQLIEYRLRNETQVNRVAQAKIPTKHGEFTVFAFEEKLTGQEHLALCFGDLTENRREPVLVRAHSECLTGDALGSLRCDCNFQLNSALQLISQHGSGVLLYLRQEGRGIGLANKIKAYALQDNEGLDTYEANEHLGFGADQREYWVGAHMLKDLGVSAIKLMTNNPDKIECFAKYGIAVMDRVPLVHVNETNKRYLEVKSAKQNHMIYT